MGQRIAAGALLLMSVVLAACASATTPTVAPTAAATPAPPAFDLDAVKAYFIHECRDPDVRAARACDQVKIADMTADGTILNVPTTLSPVARDRSQAICDEFVFAHVDSDGKPLGYEVVEILDLNGGTNAACSVN